MTTSVKPLVHWALFHKYSVRYTTRQPDRVEGIFGTPAGNVPFQFMPAMRTLVVNGKPAVTLNEYGWEVDARGEVVIKGYKPSARATTVQTQDTSTPGTDGANTEIEKTDGAGVSE